MKYLGFLLLHRHHGGPGGLQPDRAFRQETETLEFVVAVGFRARIELFVREVFLKEFKPGVGFEERCEIGQRTWLDLPCLGLFAHGLPQIPHRDRRRRSNGEEPFSCLESLFVHGMDADTAELMLSM